MRVLLGWLAQFAWLLYVACGLGAIVYVARALSLQRQLGASLTVFEREATAAQIARFWRLAAIFVLVGVALFALQVYFLPQVSPEELASSTPTLVGLVTSTPTPTPTTTPLAGALPTITATVPPPPPPTPPTPVPTATPTVPAEPAPSVPLGIRLGDVAELVGYDLASVEVRTGQGVGLTLYWRALEGAGTYDYMVFTHLRSPDGTIIAQHDGMPAGGTRPTGGWVAGELIVDYHLLIFREGALGYVGGAEIAVGLYDPAAPNVRLPVAGGGDYIVLPTAITVVGP